MKDRQEEIKMKKARRSISLLLAALMILAYPGMAFAEGQGSAAGASDDGAAVAEETTADAASKAENQGVTSEEATAPENTNDPSGNEAAEETAAPDPDPTKVTVAKSAEDLSKKSEAASGNADFFTIDASKKKTNAELATDEVSESVSEVLAGGASVSDKQEELAGVLQDSGYYMANENGKSKVDVTSKFAYQRLRLKADRAKEINAYGATKAVYYKDAYILSYDSMESTKLAYEALAAEYGGDAVLIDTPLKLSEEEEMSWGTSYMNMDYQKTLPKNRGTVTVAVLDTGIMKVHRIFDGKTILSGYDFVNNDSDPFDDNGHGTAVAGVISESTPSNVRILPVKVLDERGETSILEVYNAMDYLEEYKDRWGRRVKIDIINMSLGGYLDDKEQLEMLEEDFSDVSSLIVCASGNESANMDDENVHEFPGELSYSVCVGAFAEDESIAGFSNYGEAVDFAAPGRNIRVAALDCEYKYANGTSFAAPYISAAAALVKAGHSRMSNEAVINYLNGISDDMGEDGRDVYFGNGCPVFAGAPAPRGGDISQASVSGIQNKTYNGSAQTQDLTLVFDGKELAQDKDYRIAYKNNVNAGTASMTVSGMGDYYGKIEGLTFTIDPKSIEPAVSLSQTVYEYDGNAKTPAVTVMDGSRKLSGGTDYDVSYRDNVEVGTAHVTVTLKGNYRGSAEASFTIKEKSSPEPAPSIVPAATRLNRMSRGRGAVTLRWKKQKTKTNGSYITGYQLQVSTDSSFAGGVKTVSVKGYKKTSKKVSGLSRKTKYYGRVRTYIVSGGQTYYSDWSNVKSVKTR